MHHSPKTHLLLPMKCCRPRPLRAPEEGHCWPLLRRQRPCFGLRLRFPAHLRHRTALGVEIRESAKDFLEERIWF